MGAAPVLSSSVNWRNIFDIRYPEGGLWLVHMEIDCGGYKQLNMVGNVHIARHAPFFNCLALNKNFGPMETKPVCRAHRSKTCLPSY